MTTNSLFPDRCNNNNEYTPHPKAETSSSDSNKKYSQAKKAVEILAGWGKLRGKGTSRPSTGNVSKGMLLSPRYLERKYEEMEAGEKDFLDQMLEWTPTLIIKASPLGPCVQGANTLGIIGDWNLSHTSSYRKIVEKKLGGETNYRQFNREMESRASMQLFSWAGKAAKGFLSAIGFGLKRVANDVRPLYAFVAADLQSWLKHHNAWYQEHLERKEVFSMMIQLKFLSHVKEVVDKFHLSPEEKALYVVAARDCLLEFSERAKNGNLPEVPPPDNKSTLKQELKKQVQHLSNPGEVEENFLRHKFKRLGEKVTLLEARMKGDDLPKSGDLDQLVQVSRKLDKLRRLYENTVHFLGDSVKNRLVREAAFGLLADWQHHKASKDLKKIHEKSEQVQRELQIDEAGRQRDWMEMNRQSLAFGQWMNREFVTTHDGLVKTIDKLKNAMAVLDTSCKQEKRSIEGIRTRQEMLALKAKRKTNGKLVRVGSIVSLALSKVPVPAAQAGAMALKVGTGFVQDHREKRAAKIRLEAYQLEAEAARKQFWLNRMEEYSAKTEEEMESILTEVLNSPNLAPSFRIEAIQQMIQLRQSKIEGEEGSQVKRPKDKEALPLWYEQQKKLKSELEELRKRLEIEQEVAPYTEGVYAQAEFWQNIWLPDSEKGKIMAGMIRNAVQHYQTITYPEAMAFEWTFCTLQTLGNVINSPNLQKGAMLGTQSYRLFNIIRYFLDVGIPVATAAYTTSYGLNVIGGLPALLSCYVAPAVQAVTASYIIYRTLFQDGMGGADGQQALRQLHQHLEYLQHSLDHYMKSLGDNNKKLFDCMMECRGDIYKSRQMLQQRLDHGFQAATAHRNKKEYNGVVRELMQHISYLKKKKNDFENLPDQEKARKLPTFVSKFPGHLIQSSEGVQNGWVGPMRASEFVPPEYTSHLVENPDYFSGLLLSMALGKPLEIPSVQAYSELVKWVAAAWKTCQEVEDLETMDKIREFSKDLKQIGHILQKFYGSFSALYEKAFESQITCAKAIKTQMDFIINLGKMQDATRLQNRTSELLEYYEKKSLGNGRFILSFLYRNKLNQGLVSFPSRKILIEKGKEELPAWKDRLERGLKATAGGLLGGVAPGGAIAIGGVALASNPIGWVAAGVTILSLAVIATGAATAIAIKNRSKKLSEFKRFKKTVGKAGLGSEVNIQKPVHVKELPRRPGAITVQVVAEKKLHNLRARSIEYKPEDGGILSADIHLDKESKGIEVLRMEYFYDQQTTATNKVEKHWRSWRGESKNFVKEKEVQLQYKTTFFPGYVTEIPDWKMGKAVTVSHIKEYLDWLLKKSDSTLFRGIQRREVEAFIKEQELFDSKAKPALRIVFPKKCLKEVGVERRIQAAKGNRLTPSYSFKWDQDLKRYTLHLNYWAISQKNECLGKRMEVLIATFDKDTRQAFRPIYVDGNGLKPKNSNKDEFTDELLAAALFGSSWSPEHGMPGEGTRAFHSGKLVMSKDLPFAGIVPIAKEHGRVIHYDSSKYNGSLEESGILGEKFEVKILTIKSLDQEEKIQPPSHFESYKNLHDVVMAVGKSITVFNTDTLRAIVEDIGLKMPAGENYTEIYKHVARHGVPAYPHTPVQELVEGLQKSFEPSPLIVDLEAKQQFLSWILGERG